jgi:hypothetical protein
MPDIPPEGAAGPATASDVDVSGGLGPPPETPPRTVSDLAAGVPITPAPSLEAQGDRWAPCLSLLPTWHSDMPSCVMATSKWCSPPSQLFCPHRQPPHNGCASTGAGYTAACPTCRRRRRRRRFLVWRLHRCRQHRCPCRPCQLLRPWPWLRRRALQVLMPRAGGHVCVAHLVLVSSVARGFFSINVHLPCRAARRAAANACKQQPPGVPPFAQLLCCRPGSQLQQQHRARHRHVEA